jgi:hypothetical protein
MWPAAYSAGAVRRHDDLAGGDALGQLARPICSRWLRSPRYAAASSSELLVVRGGDVAQRRPQVADTVDASR